MKEDYLWDKSGAADQEVEHLEKALGQLRYKAPAIPLPLPNVSRRWFQRRFSSIGAIAAGIVLLIIAGGLWLSFRSAVVQGPLQIVSGPAPHTGPIEITAHDGPHDDGAKPLDETGTPEPQKTRIRGAHRSRQQLVRNTEASRERLQRAAQMTRRGELAKEQLIKALLITSDKLNTVQKRIQGPLEQSPIS